MTTAATPSSSNNNSAEAVLGTSISTDWINDFITLFRCPDTHQPLRWATAQDLAAHGRNPEEKALVTKDSTRLFEIDQGIPILLPQPRPAQQTGVTE